MLYEYNDDGSNSINQKSVKKALRVKKALTQKKR